ncbi:MAG TPA: hypothetical protein VGQ15_05235 [Gaiellaceae bacterium]|nr:hypothetical protein [Gaiellaceae bacterium]
MARLPAPVFLGALVAALAFLAAGCGGGGSEESEPEGTPPGQWVTSVCGALDEWQTSLQNEARELPSEVLQADSPADAKKKIGDFLDQVVDETDAMVQKVDEAGNPAVDAGDRIAARVHARLVKVKAAFESARQKVEQVPTDDPVAFQQQLTQIGRQLLAQGQALGDVLGTADAEPLRDAVESTPRCKSFSGS